MSFVYVVSSSSKEVRMRNGFSMNVGTVDFPILKEELSNLIHSLIVVMTQTIHQLEKQVHLND